MMDDNLSDVQQLVKSKGYQDALKEGMRAIEEKKMSAEQISFECECGRKLVIRYDRLNEELKFLEPDEFLALTRDEAQLLMLYLQEHLK